jgi:putative endopeptidase
MRPLKIALLAGAVLAGTQTSAQAPQPFYPPWGYDLTAFDRATKPGDDFFQFANGAYLARTAIPADRVIASRRFEMTDRMEADLKAILEDAAAGSTAQPSDIKGKVGAFYASYLDAPLAERLGATALKAELDAIRAADRSGLARLMGASASGLYPSPFSLGIDIDLKAPDAYALYLGQGGLGLPDRD